MSSLLHRTSSKSSKCKKHLQCTLERIRILRNKRTILVKQARADVAKLLRNHQEASAHARVEHAYKEQNILEAYNILEQCCESLISGMRIIDSKKEYPPNLLGSIATLIYAAPRCGDLPELQSIREFVTLKLGTDFVTAAVELRAGCGVSNQVIQSLSSRAPNGQTKLKLLKQIAQEYKIKWDHVAVVPDSFRKSTDSQDGSNNYATNEVRMTDSTEEQKTQLKPSPEMYSLKAPLMQSPGNHSSSKAGFSEETLKSEPPFASDKRASASQAEGLDKSLSMNEEAVAVSNAEPILEREVDEPSQGFVKVEERAQAQFECDHLNTYASSEENAFTSNINGEVAIHVPLFDDYGSSSSSDEVETQSNGEGRASAAMKGYEKPISLSQFDERKDLVANLSLKEGLQDMHLLGGQKMLEQRSQVRMAGKLAVPMHISDDDDSVKYNDIEAFREEEESLSGLSLKRINKPVRGSMKHTEDLGTKLQTRKTLSKQRLEMNGEDILDSHSVQEPFYTKNRGVLGSRQPSREMQSDRTKRYIESRTASIKQTYSQDSSENVNLQNRWEEEQLTGEMHSARPKRYIDRHSKGEIASNKQTHSEESFNNVKLDGEWEENYIGRLESDEHLDSLDLTSHANSQTRFQSVVRSLDYRQRGSNGSSKSMRQQTLDRRGEALHKLKLKQDEQYYMESLQFHDDDAVSVDLSDHSSSSQSPRSCHDYMSVAPHDANQVVKPGLGRNLEYRKPNLFEPSLEANRLNSLHVPSEVHGPVWNSGIQVKRRDVHEEVMASSGKLRWKSTHDFSVNHSEPYGAAKEAKSYKPERAGVLLSEAPTKPILQGKSFYGESRRTTSRT